MNSFGYKMGWFAIRNADKKSVLAALGLNAIKELSWDEGIDAIYDREEDIPFNTVFITPPVNGWTFVVGRWAMGAGGEDIVDVEKLITKLSIQFGEVQSFATYRVVDYHHWMLAKNGHLIRSFALEGDGNGVLTNKGKLTQIEESYEWDQLLKFYSDEEDQLDELEQSPDEEDQFDEFWFPDEETVMEVAGSWSINPTEIEDLSLDEDSGILASSPGTTGKQIINTDIDSIDFDEIDSVDIGESVFHEGKERKKPWWKFW